MSEESEKAIERMGDLNHLDPAIKEHLLKMAEDLPELPNKQIWNNGLTSIYYPNPEAPCLSMRLRMNENRKFLPAPQKQTYTVLAMLTAQLMNQPADTLKSKLTDVRDMGYNLLIHVSGPEIELESTFVNNDKFEEVLALYKEKVMLGNASKRVEHFKERLSSINPAFQKVLDYVTSDNIQSIISHLTHPKNMTLILKGALPPEQVNDALGQSSLVLLKGADEHLTLPHNLTPLEKTGTLFRMYQNPQSR